MKRLFITSVSLLLLHATAAVGQSTWHKQRKFFTLGATTGAYITDKDLKMTKHSTTCYTSGLYLRRYINKQLSISSGVRYSVDQFETPVFRVTPAYYASRTQPATTNIPLAMQYYLTPANSKVKPFVGVGCYYSIGKKPVSTTIENITFTNYATNNKFVPFYFTQGFTFKLSPKIDINESVHFTPNDENNCKQLGIDIGFGIHL